MLYNNNVVLRGLKTSDELRRLQSLLNIKIGTRFIKDVDLSFGDAHNHCGETLEFPSRQLFDISVIQMGKLEIVLKFFGLRNCVFLLDDLSDLALNSFWDLIYILQFGDGFEIVL